MFLATRRWSPLVLCLVLISAGVFGPAAGSDPPISVNPPLSDCVDIALLEPRTPVAANTTPGDGGFIHRITQPGSYYLTCNIGPIPDKNGIEIAVGGVTLDLNGFSVIGTSSQYSVDGILVPSSVKNVTIHNGTVRGWRDGVHVVGKGVRLERMTASDNQRFGFVMGTRVLILECTARNNLTGFHCPDGAVLRDCVSSDNSQLGFSAGYAAITGCSAAANGGFGIAASRSTLNGCSASSNGSDGISASGGSTVKDCSATSNLGHGIVMFGGGGVFGCTVSLNKGDGIRVGSDSLVLENTARGNGAGAEGDGAGIHVTAGVGRNRIEGNNASENDRGIDVDGTDNLVIRNSARSNTLNYSVVPGNAFGSIVNGSNIATNDKPHSNYEM